MPKYIKQEELRALADSINRIFFYNICGSGMGAAATLMQQDGVYVEGGDHIFAPPMNEYLKDSGIKVHHLDQVSDNHLKTFDLIVVGNVVPKGQEDAQRIEQLGVPLVSFPALLGATVLSRVNVVGISGTHGKTTTTYFFTQVFEKLNQDPGYFIGGVIEGRTPAYKGGGKYFFIESDEYDSAYFEKISKFRLYSIDNLIITSLEFDHADIFGSLSDISDQFIELLKSIKNQVIFCSDYPEIKKLQKDNSLSWVSYGKSSTIGPEILKEDESGTEFALILEGNREVFRTNVVGRHNIDNLTAVILFSVYEGFPLDKIRTAVSNLSLVKRRQEIRGKYNGAVVIDDFAHHPSAINLTIESVKTLYPSKRINVVFEPRSATARSSIFSKKFEESLAAADRVVVTALSKPTTVAGATDLDLTMMTNNLNNSHGIDAEVARDLPHLLSLIDSMASEDDVLLILSNGTCLDLWQSDFVHKIEK